MNLQLEQIAEKGAENLKTLLHESADKIREAWESALAEAELQETAPRFRLNYQILISPDESKVEYQVSFSIRYKVSVEDELPDPSQPQFTFNKN
jgi:hypothetical protein